MSKSWDSKYTNYLESQPNPIIGVIPAGAGNIPRGTKPTR